MPDLAQLTERMLDIARRAGADSADAMAVSSAAVSVEVRGGKLEQAERSESVDIGLRVFVGRRGAIVSGSDIRDDSLAGMAERAVAMAREAPEDPFAGLAEPGQLATDTDNSRLDLFDPAPEPDPAWLEEVSRRAEAAAMAVPGVTQVQSAGAGYGRRQSHIAASNGFSAGNVRSDIGWSCTAIAGAGAGMERDYHHDSRIFAADLIAPEEIGRIAAERAVARLHPRKPPTGRYPVLFDERLSGGFIGHLLGAVNGAAIARGTGFLRDRLGERILPAGLDLIEEPHRPRVGGSRMYDAEGLPTVTRHIIRDGVLMGWSLDLAAARKLGMESTANAVRGPGGQPSPSAGNVTLTPGAASRADLIRDMGAGLLVTEMIGSTINANTGDYSRGASGFWVENGEITHAISECTVAGNLLDMFARIQPANDARQHIGRRVPSILIDGLMLAGA